MIESFGNRLTGDLFFDLETRETRRFPSDLRRVARREVLLLHDAAELSDLQVPPGNQLEAVEGRLRRFHSIRINDQWRIVFRWKHGNAFEVAIVDFH